MNQGIQGIQGINPAGEWYPRSPAQAISDPDQIAAWRPRLLTGAFAVFTSRHGGVSPAPWASLNLAYHVQDEPERVSTNRDRVTATLQLPTRTWVTAEQVHDAGVGVADDLEIVGARARKHEPDHEPGPLPGKDALVTSRPELPLALFYADCVPLFFAAPGVVGLAHAGWRGTLAGVAEATLRVLQERFGVVPGDVWVAIGPAVGPCCYEVSEELWKTFRRRFGEAAAVHDRRVDLPAANRELLLRLGVPPGQVETANICTSCRPDLFYSHRRDGFPTGRMAALIYRRPD